MSLAGFSQQLFEWIRSPWIAWKTALTEARIRQSVRSEDALLAFVAGGRPFQSRILVDSTDFVCPELTLHAAEFNDLVDSVPLSFRICLDLTGDQRTILESSITLSQEPLLIEGIAIRWSGTRLAELRGPAVLRIRVENKDVATFPLTLLSWNDFAEQIRVTDLQLHATLRDRRVIALPGRIGKDQLVSVAPSFTVENPGLAPNSVFSGRFIVFQGDHVLAGVPLEIRPDRERIEFRMKPARLPKPLLAEVPVEVRVEIATRAKATHSIDVLDAAPITTFDGSLSADAATIPVSE